MTNELRGLHRLLDALENGKMTMRMHGQDVTEREIALIKREIADDKASGHSSGSAAATLGQPRPAGAAARPS
jgi:hypothetical protein